DSRSGAPFASGETRPVALIGAEMAADASAVLTNLTADQGVAVGFFKVYPSGTPAPSTSNLNYDADSPVANAGLLGLGVGGAVDVFVYRQAHVIIDVNGYFTGPR